MRLRSKPLAMAASVACLTFMAVGCSGTPASPPSNTPVSEAASAAPAPATVRVMLWGNDQDVSSVKNAAAGFTTAHPEITIQWESGDCGVDYAACKTLVAGGNMPDVVVLGSWDYFEAVRDGVVADLTSYMSGSGVSASDFTPKVIDALKTTDGKIFGLPMGYNIQSLFYNKAMFDKAGLSYPPADGSYTYDDLRQWAAKLTLDKSGKNSTQAGFDPKQISQYGYFNFAALPIPQGYGPVLAAFGGGILGGADGKQCLTDSKGTIDGFQWLQDLMWKDHSAITPQLQQEESGNARWVRGQVAMQQGSHEQVPAVLAQNPSMKFGISALPKGPSGNSTLMQIHVWAMANGSQVKDAAWSFINFMATDGSSQKPMGLIPAYKDIAQGDAFAKAPGEPADIVAAQLTPASWPLTFTNTDPGVVASLVTSQDGVQPAIEDIIMNRKTAAGALTGTCASKVEPLLKGAK